MKRILAVLCTVLCLISFFACRKTPQAPPDEAPSQSEPITITVPEWRMIAVWHLPTKEGENADDSVVYSNTLSAVYFEALVAEIESAVFTPDPTAEFDYSEYYDINFYPKDSLQQYAVSISVNGVVNVERQLCRVSEGVFSFARVGGYFEMFQKMPADSAGN